MIEEIGSENNLQLEGGTISKIKPRLTFDFKGIETIVNKDAELKALKKQSQNAYIEGLKGITMVDEEGTIIEPAVPKYSKEGYSIKLNKNG